MTNYIDLDHRFFYIINYNEFDTAWMSEALHRTGTKVIVEVIINLHLDLANILVF